MKVLKNQSTVNLRGTIVEIVAHFSRSASVRSNTDVILLDEKVQAELRTQCQ